ncbi:hypothetical protein [Micromonospora chersina]|uniref:hypothetical protein n=1 Tax=Micromonospora chersina TaxID=47854 RepID=UPI00340681B0
MDDTGAKSTPTSTGQPEATYTSSTPPDVSPSADPVTALGERIVAELGDARTNNILTRWLAHHTARLLDAADRARAAGDPDADARAAEARAAILDLWEHRSAWPGGWPPSRAAAIVHLLQELPDIEDPKWFRATALRRLQDIHHHVLAVLADLVAVPGDGVEEGWLRTFGDLLTPDEATLLTRAAGAPQRLDSLLRRRKSVISGLRRRLMVSEPSPAAGKADNAWPHGAGPTKVEEDDSPPPHPLVQLADAYRDSILDLLNRAAKGTGGGEVAGHRFDGDDGVDGVTEMKTF